jgi:hypothetical protein
MKSSSLTSGIAPTPAGTANSLRAGDGNRTRMTSLEGVPPLAVEAAEQAASVSRSGPD